MLNQVVETMTFEVFVRYICKIEEIPEHVGLPVASGVGATFFSASRMNNDHTCMASLLKQFQLYHFYNFKLLYQYIYLC
jgi:hypothetical protein